MHRTPPLTLLALPCKPGRWTKVFRDGDFEHQVRRQAESGPQVLHQRDEVHSIATGPRFTGGGYEIRGLSRRSSLFEEFWLGPPLFDWNNPFSRSA
jgi:hypothetical protein